MCGGGVYLGSKSVVFSLNCIYSGGSGGGVACQYMKIRADLDPTPPPVEEFLPRPPTPPPTPRRIRRSTPDICVSVMCPTKLVWLYIVNQNTGLQINDLPKNPTMHIRLSITAMHAYSTILSRRRASRSSSCARARASSSSLDNTPS